MSPSLRRDILRVLDRLTELGVRDMEPVIRRIRDRIAEHPRPAAFLKVIAGGTRAERKAERRKAHTTMTSLVRAACLLRAAGRCECGCGAEVDEFSAHMDHFFGGSARKSGTNTRNCWMLTALCHDEKTRWWPAREVWFLKFLNHLSKHRLPVPPKLMVNR